MISKAKKLSYFQNLYIIALSDNLLAEEEKMFLHQIAEEMGLSKKDIEPIMNANPATLELIIPESREEKAEQLENLFLMVMADKRVFKNELDLCMAFGRKNGFSKKEVDDLMKKVLGMNPSKINVKIYEDIFSAIKSSNIPISRITKAILEYDRNINPDLSDLDIDEKKLMYQFLWLLLVRSSKLQKDLYSAILTYCDLLESGEKSLDDLQNLLVPMEKNYGKNLIQWYHLSLEELKEGFESFVHKEE